MTLLLVFVGTLFTIFALWRMVSPFAGGLDVTLRLEHLDDEIREIELLVARRQVLLTSLRELEFDRETDKIAPEDYARFRARYEREAVAILKRLDEIHGGQAWQARVDEELAARLGRAPSLSAGGDEDVAGATADDADDADDAAAEAVQPPAHEEPEPAAHETAAAEPDGAGDTSHATSSCASCGEPLDDTDKFCAQCGTPVGPREERSPAMSAPEASA